MRLFAVVAELADAHDSGSCFRKKVWVQVPSTAFVLIKIITIKNTISIFEMVFLIVIMKKVVKKYLIHS